MAGRGRSHSTLGFHQEKTAAENAGASARSFWHDQVQVQGVQAASHDVALRRASRVTHIGRANEPAASHSYDSRKKNLGPAARKDLTAPPKQPPTMTKSVIATKPAYKIRQMEREERTKNRYKVPEIVGKIEAEKQIMHNPLLFPDGKDGEHDDDTSVRNITALSLQDLCRLRVAFEQADDDRSGALDQDEFVDAFLPVLGVDVGDVHLLFMRIDADSDGTVTWEEFLSYVLSQDEGKLQIATESSRQLLDNAQFSDNALQIHGHKDSAGGLLHLEETDRYVSFSRKGEVLLWRPDCLDSVTKSTHPREFQTNLPFITQLVHIKRLAHSDRLAVCSADKQLIFLDLMRESTKLTGQIKMDVSPLCMCAVIIKDDMGDIVDEMICFGDDQGQLHLYNSARLNQNAERNMISASSSTEVWQGAKDAHIKTWKAHENHAWIAKVGYYDDSRIIISCASDGQLVISDAMKGLVKIDGFRHRGDISDFIWLKKIQLLASCGLERHINLWQIPIKNPVYKLEGHQGSIQQLVFGAGQLISIDTHKTIIVWDLREMAPIQRLEGMKMHQEFPVGRMMFDSKKNGLVTMARKPLFWSITERKVPSGHTTSVSSAVYNPMFQTLVSADESSVIRVWNLNTGQAIIRFTDAHVNAKGEPVKITSTIFDSTARRLITGAHDGTMKLWNYSTGQQLKEFVGFGEGEVTGIATIHLTPYDYIFATGWNRKVSFWLDPHSLPADTAAALLELKPQHHMEGTKEDILCMACYPSTQLLVTGSYDGDIIIWNLESGHVRAHLVLPGLASMTTDQKPVEAMQLTGMRSDMTHTVAPKAKRNQNLVVLLFTASGDGVLRIWSTDATAELLFELPMEKDTVEAGMSAMAACERSKVLVIATNQGDISVWSISSTLESAKKALPPISAPLVAPTKCAKFKAHSESISCLLYITERRLIVTGCTDCTLCLWTVMGEKMGTFGDESDWKLTSKMHDFGRTADQAVFSKAFAGDLVDDGDGSKKDKSKRFVRKTHTDRFKDVLSPSVHAAKDIEIPSNPQPEAKVVVVLPEKCSPFQKGGDAHCESAFLTQLEVELGFEGELVGVGAAEVEEDLEENWEEYYSSRSNSDNDFEIEDDTSPVLDVHLSEHLARSLVLKEDISAIIARGMAMKDRGDKFFEAGSNEMGTYRKMIVRDLGNFPVPEKIQRKMYKAGGKKGLASQGNKGLVAQREESDHEEELPGQDASAATQSAGAGD